MSTAGFFVAGLAAIVVAAELFTNAVEWAGYRLKLASGATGSLLAALGTSLPETVVPVVALLTGAPGATAVATGAVLGSSFLLLGVGVSITGVAVLFRRGRRTLTIQPAQARRDLGVFCIAFSLVLVGVLLPLGARIALGIALLMAYAAYVRATLRGGGPTGDVPEPLHLLRWRPGEPRMAMIATQLLLSVGLLVLGSELFVHALDDTAAALHANPLTLALVVVPLATELPETFNSVLWVRSRDDDLAFGNVAGSAAFQSCVLGFLGLSFTPWRPDFNGILSGLLTLGVALGLLALLRDGRAHGRWLVAAGVPWAGYVVAQLVSGGHLGS